MHDSLRCSKERVRVGSFTMGTASFARRLSAGDRLRKAVCFKDWSPYAPVPSQSSTTSIYRRDMVTARYGTVSFAESSHFNPAVSC